MFLRLMRFDAPTRIFSFRVGLSARIFLPFLYHHQLALDTFAYPFQPKKNRFSLYLFDSARAGERTRKSYDSASEKQISFGTISCILV